MIIAIAILAGYFLLSVRKPAWGLGLIMAGLPLYMVRIKLFGIPTTALELGIGVFLLSVLLANFNRQAWDRLRGLGQINTLAGLFLLAAGIAAAFSPETARALGQMKAYFIEPVLLFYAATLVLDGEGKARTALKALFAAASAIGAFATIQYWTHVWLPVRFWGYGVEMKRVTSVFEYPNALALYLAPLFVLFLALELKGYRLASRRWSWLGLLAMGSALVLTYSRGAWLGIMAACFVLLARETSLPWRRWRYWIAVGLAILAPVMYGRLKTTFQDGASSERVALYKVAAGKLLDNPVFGNGLYGFRTTLEESGYGGEVLNYPHNIILNFWLETGLLGVLAFAMLFYWGMRRYGTAPNTLRLAAGLALVTILVHGMVDVPYFKNDLSAMFWFIMALFALEE